MRLPSPWSCNLLIQPAVLPHQPSTATHTEEDSSLGKASITAPPVEASLGLKATVATATCAPSSALSARGLPPQDGNSSVSLIMSDGPSPRSQWSSKTQQPVPPLSSSSYLPHHRPSVDIEVQGRDTSPLVTRNAYTVVTSDSSIAHVVGSQTTDGDSSHTLLRASDTMPTEFFASSPLLRGMVRSPEVSTNLEGACFEVTGPEVMQPAAAEMLCIPPQLTATNGRRSPQAVIPCTIGAVAAAATSAVVKDRTNYIDATVSVKDTMQRGAGSGPYAHPSQVSPPSSEGNRPGTSAHNSLQRLHFRKPSLVSHTTNTLPSWTADAASSTGFGSEYSFYSLQHTPRAGVAQVPEPLLPPRHRQLSSQASFPWATRTTNNQCRSVCRTTAILDPYELPYRTMNLSAALSTYSSGIQRRPSSKIKQQQRQSLATVERLVTPLWAVPPQSGRGKRPKWRRRCSLVHFGAQAPWNNTHHGNTRATMKKCPAAVSATRLSARTVHHRKLRSQSIRCYSVSTKTQALLQTTPMTTRTTVCAHPMICHRSAAPVAAFLCRPLVSPRRTLCPSLVSNPLL
ncbi:hypothetical protein, conserved [Leishmania tarentolae]|uniref:Uncharacterized protein n=1 Tax=Leishmania tarentolae TaxID=5689 RepID=A0A640KN93_LEITA|nr:hypothetical protein, conserved [Leishmania tarentolae]